MEMSLLFLILELTFVSPLRLVEGHLNANNSWKQTTLNLNENSIVVCDRKDYNHVELTDDSDVRLEYDPLAIQESVCFYLESEFKNYENFSSSSLTQSCGFDAEFHITDDEHVSSNSDVLQKEFEGIRSASQKLLVDNSDESCNSSSGAIDHDSRGFKKKAEEYQNLHHADKRTHQLTMEDIYTQEIYFSSSDSCSPVKKRSRIQSVVPISSLGSFNGSLQSDNISQEHGSSTCVLMVPRVSENLTLLRDCTKENSILNVLFVVTQVNDVRDVQIKSGINAGSFVALASLVIADESKSRFKLTLWKEASRWTEKITPGDFAIATSIKIGKWREEYVGQTTFNSGFYNLHQPKATLSKGCLKLVSQVRLDSLVRWVRSEHSYLLAGNNSKKNVEFTEITHLHDNTLVHFRGKLISVHEASSSSSTYRFDVQRLTKVSTVLSDRPSEEVELFLWGRQAAWENQLREGLGQVWEFQFLTAKFNSDSGCMTLHSTPRSTKYKLNPKDKNSQCFMSRFNGGGKETTKFVNIRDLLESKYTGLAEFNAKISSVRFNCANEVIVVSHGQIESANTKLRDKLAKIVYIGCGSCSRVLPQDQNSVYGQCSHCIVTDANYEYTIDHYYKPLIICLSDSHLSVEVEAFNDVTTGLFRDFPAKTLWQRTANASSRDSSYSDGFLECVGALVKGEIYKSIVACRIELDENSFVENRYFTLRAIHSL
ncbi:Protein FAM35A [Stylophora pistillata]|uniref:Protein FAM35A n=1 Tax=Stylophora pistillata TaxID=50429 RepID=A0A2B4SGS4_STYPI|nr:Protein FAM35A [Stylophora pistillata]